MNLCHSLSKSSNNSYYFYNLSSFLTRQLMTQVMMISLVSSLILSSILFSEKVKAEDKSSNDISIIDKIYSDYGHFYSMPRLKRMGIAYLALGVVANTDADKEIQNWYQDDVRGNDTDRFSKTAKKFGEQSYLIPLSLLASTAYYMDSDSAIGNWGINTARAYAVGGPATLIMQRATGGSRPGETTNDAKWQPLDDNNGVSGHAFIGAVPFLTIAKMNDDNKFIQYTAFAASALTAWSRVNDNSHYTSQAILGWYMAYEAVDAVNDTNNENNNVTITPIIGDKVFGLNISASF